MSKLTPDEIEQGIQEGRYRRLHTGGVQDLETGRFLTPPDANHRVPITQETSRQMHELRKEKMMRATIAGLANATDARSSAATWQAIIKNQAQIAMDPKQGKAATGAAVFLARFLGIYEGAKKTPDPANNAVTVQIPAEIALELAQMAASLRARRAMQAGSEPVTLDVTPK